MRGPSTLLPYEITAKAKAISNQEAASPVTKSADTVTLDLQPSEQEEIHFYDILIK